MLWENRTDLGDTLEFARELRQRAGIRGSRKCCSKSSSDTDALIDILRRHPPAMQSIATVGGSCVSALGTLLLNCSQGCFNKSHTEDSLIAEATRAFAIIGRHELRVALTH